MSRRSTTLVDDSLLAGAFLCYVTWALAGWRWLVPPAILFIGYAWFSPRTAENSRRIHSVDAVLAIWIVAIAWLTLSRTLDRPALIYPFTLVFAAHMAIFGLSRLAHLDLTHSVRPLAAASVVRAWVLIFGPFVITQGASLVNLSLTVLAAGCIALSVAVFAATEPDLHNAGTESRALDATSGGRRGRVGRRLGRAWWRSSDWADQADLSRSRFQHPSRCRRSPQGPSLRSTPASVSATRRIGIC